MEITVTQIMIVVSKKLIGITQRNAFMLGLHIIIVANDMLSFQIRTQLNTMYYILTVGTGGNIISSCCYSVSHNFCCL